MASASLLFPGTGRALAHPTAEAGGLRFARVRADDVIAVAGTYFGIRDEVSYPVYTALRALRAGTLPYGVGALRDIGRAALTVEQFEAASAMVTEYGPDTVARDRVPLAMYPFANGRSREDFGALTDYARHLGDRLRTVVQPVAVEFAGLHDAGVPPEEVVAAVRSGMELRAVLAAAAEGVSAPVADGWL